MHEDEKKPPVGGVVDYALVRRRNQVRGRLLEVRSQLEAAAHVCWSAGLHPCGDEVDRFVNSELDALFRRVLRLVEEAPATRVPPEKHGG